MGLGAVAQAPNNRVSARLPAAQVRLAIWAVHGQKKGVWETLAFFKIRFSRCVALQSR
jgi:hypothetical protein